MKIVPLLIMEEFAFPYIAKALMHVINATLKYVIKFITQINTDFSDA